MSIKSDVWPLEVRELPEPLHDGDKYGVYNTETQKWCEAANGDIATRYTIAEAARLLEGFEREMEKFKVKRRYIDAIMRGHPLYRPETHIAQEAEKAMLKLPEQALFYLFHLLPPSEKNRVQG